MIGSLGDRPVQCSGFTEGQETGKSKSKVSADLVSVENPIPGLQMAAMLLCPLMAQRK